MIEIAFKVDRSSDFYKKYFDVKDERQKFHDLARAFFEEHNLASKGGYYQCESLYCELDEEEKKKFSNQITKYEDKNGLTRFRKNSALQKAWTENVVSKIDMKMIDSIKFWWLCYVHCGSYALWDKNGEIYGYLSEKNDKNIQMADWMIQIKMSEYYSVIEKEVK